MATSNGRIALVTGSAQGIGRSIALRLANDGFDIAVNDIPSKAESLEDLKHEIINDKGRKAVVVVGDVSKEEDVKQMIESVVESLGSLDVMVANAGISILSTLVDQTVENWDRIFSINARGTFLCYKYAAIQMLKQNRGGRIVGASSMAGKLGQPLGSAYSATKFAVRGLTQSAAQELGPHGITVNAYAPVGVASDGMGASVLEHLTKSTAIGKIGEPEDIASFVSYIVSKEAHFITGQTINVNGGWVYD